MKSKLSKDEKHLAKLNDKLHHYTNTYIGINSEYDKYNCPSGKRTFKSETQHKEYLEKLQENMKHLQQKMDYVKKDIKDLEDKLKK